MRDKKKNTLSSFIVIPIIGVLFLFNSSLIEKKIFAYYDSFFFNIPTRIWFFKGISEGRIPLWTRDIFCGFPLFAEGQLGPLYPLNMLLFRSLPFVAAYQIALALCFVIAWSGMFFWMRSRRLRVDSSALAATAFAFSAVFLGRAQQLNILQSMVWTPFALLLCEACVRKFRPLTLVAAAAIISTMFLSVHHHFVFFSLIIMMVYIAGNDEEHSIDIKGISLLFILCLISAAVASWNLLPTAELFKESARAATPTFADMPPETSLHPLHILTALLPNLLGNPFRNAQVFSGLVWEETFYIGVIPFILALFGIRRYRTNKTVRISFWLVAICLFLALGMFNPISKMLFIATPLKIFGKPCRLSYCIMFGLCVLSAYGMESILGAMKSRKVSMPYVITIVVATASMILSFVFRGKLTESIFSFAREKGAAFQHVADIARLNPALSNADYIERWTNYSQTFPMEVSIALFMIGMFLTLLFLLKHGLFLPNTFAVAVICFSFIDLCRIGNSWIPLTPSTVLKKPSYVDVIKKDIGHYRIYQGKLTPSFRIPYQPNADLMYGLTDMGGYTPLVPYRFTAFEKIATPDMLKLAGVRFITYFVYESKTGEAGYAKYYEKKTNTEIVSGDSRIFKNIYTPIRAKMYFDSRWAVNADSALSSVRARDFEKSEIVILEGDGKTDVCGTPGEYASRINWIDDTDELVKLNVQTEGRGCLYLSDTWYPGWRATVDGIETKIYRANYLFRAVPIEAGNHTVVFEYKPSNVIHGMWISLTALAGLFLVLFAEKLRSKRSH